MWIIAGELKGRRLEAPAGDRVRPTSEKVKEAIFSMVEGYYRNGIAVDLFCGTGGLGLEALSRGAARVYFGDLSRESMDLTRKNIAHCGAEDRCVCLLGGWERTLSRIPSCVDLFLLDPPYGAGILEDCISEIAERDLLSGDGLIVAEHSSDLKLPERIGDLETIRDRSYGKISVTLYARCAEKEEESEGVLLENETSPICRKL